MRPAASGLAVELAPRGGRVWTGDSSCGACSFFELRGDIWPRAECRRWGLYQASMKSNTAILATAWFRRLLRSIRPPPVAYWLTNPMYAE